VNIVPRKENQCEHTDTHPPILTEPLVHFTLIKKKCICKKERKMSLSDLINNWYILLYHKCKVEYIKLRVVKVVLISVIIEKK